MWHGGSNEPTATDPLTVWMGLLRYSLGVIFLMDGLSAGWMIGLFDSIAGRACVRCVRLPPPGPSRLFGIRRWGDGRTTLVRTSNRPPCARLVYLGRKWPHAAHHITHHITPCCSRWAHTAANKRSQCKLLHMTFERTRQRRQRYACAITVVTCRGCHGHGHRHGHGHAPPPGATQKPPPPTHPPAA